MTGAEGLVLAATVLAVMVFVAEGKGTLGPLAAMLLLTLALLAAVAAVLHMAVRLSE